VDAGAQFCANCGADVSAEQGLAATRRMTPASATALMHNQLLDRLRRAALGEYEILAELGRGGMASVYLAHDLQLDRKVAIKVMLPSLLEGEGMAERFKLEARTAANLSHPHIIPIFAVRDTEHLLYFVMKFVEGRPLDTILREVGRLPIPMAQTILSKVGEALGYAHRQGVVHRDIKPANLMIDVEGQPIVTDFGIAKVAEMSGLTMTGATIGTPTYMSPEQATASPITGASDQYSLGIVAYQMLSGHLPFNGDTMVSLLYQHCHEPPPPFLTERPECPPELHEAVMRMLAKDPADRFPNLEEAVECIGRVNLSFDDPVRTQLVDLAMKGGNRKILEGVKTPRSPIPTRAKATARGGATGRVAAGEDHAATRAAAAPTRSRAPLWIALVAVLVVGGGLAAVFRPWEGASATPQTTPASPTAVVASLSVTPASTALQVSGTVQLQAAARDAAGQPVSLPVTWTSADPGIATVTSTGLVEARTPGTIAVRASVGGIESTALVTVEPAGTKVAATPPPAGASAVASIRVEEQPASLTVGASARLRAVALDARGTTLAGRAIRWSSADPSRARITPDGVITALSAGDATFIARSESVDRSVVIPVVALRAASVTVSAIAEALTVGATARLSAAVVAADGRAVDSPVTWRSSDPRVASVSGGLVTATGAGVATISASADGQEGSTTVRVVAEEVARPAAEPPPRPAAVADPREAVEAAIQAYARAMESRQIAEVRRAYPGIQPEQESQVAQTLRSMEQLKVTMRVVALNVAGSTATANVTGQYEFRSRDTRRDERLPVELIVTLESSAGGWVIRQIRNR